VKLKEPQDVSASSDEPNAALSSMNKRNLTTANAFQ